MEITPPEKFSFDTYKWNAWKQRFERFRTASDLTSKAGERQVSMLPYSMGEKSEEIFASFKLSEEDGKKYEDVINRFEDQFIVKKNKRFEISNCNKRTQGENKSAESFITAAHKLAEICECGDLREELICGRIKAGIRDQKLATKLLLDDKLTLDKCILQVDQEEEVRRQQYYEWTAGCMLSIPSKISQDTSKSLRHINSLRYKPVNQHIQCHLSFCANSPKRNNGSLCHRIAASGVVEIATTGTHV